MKLRCFVLAALMGFCFSPAWAGRTWTDSTGKFQVDAELVRVEDGKVVLKRDSDGQTIAVPLDRLSETDQEFLKNRTSPAAESTLVRDLEERAQKQRTAAQAVKLYEAFLSTRELSASDRKLVSQRLEAWQRRAESKSVRLGDAWMSLDEAEKIEQEEERLIAESERLLEVESFDNAVDKLKEASRANPESIQADFILGFYYAQVVRDADTAQRHFQQCVNRRQSNLAALDSAERANLVAALNNLALTEVRDRDYRKALLRWRSVLEFGGVTPEIVQNLGRFSNLPSSHSYLKVPDALARDAAELYAAVSVGTGADKFDRRTGWLYMPMVDEPTAKERVEGAQRAAPPIATPEQVAAGQDLVQFASGTGFVVQPQYVLTNRHVVEDADHVALVAPDGTGAPLSATIVATSSTDDLALLKCESLTSQPVQLAKDVPRLGTEIATLGYPQTTLLGNDLKVTRGTVSGLPNPRVENLLLFDAVINPGSSGGPVCDRSGQVVAVSTLGITLQLGNLFGGVPATRVRPFLQSHFALPDPSPAEDELSWADVVDRVQGSTVYVLVYQKASSLNLAKRLAPGGAANPRSPDGQWNAWEDPWCMACYGSDQLTCPSPCSGGRQKVKTTERIGFNSVTRRPVLRDKWVYQPCSRCAGQGHVRCPVCAGGIDPTFFGN